MAKLFLPSLPVCPYCKTIYRYGDVRRMINKKSEECYHCKKKFKISKKKLIILIAEIVLISIAVNLLIINFIDGITPLILYIISLILITVGYFWKPYYVMFVKI